MAAIENQPAMKLHRQPRAHKAPQKNNNEQAMKDFAQGLGQVTAALAQTAAGIAGGPGAGMAVGNLFGGGLGTGTLGGLGGLGGVGGLAGGTDFQQQLALIQLQRQIQAQTQIFETLSNVSKAEHDARMSAVRNMRP